MKKRKIGSITMLLVIMLLVISVIVIHTVGASTSNEGEVTKSGNDDKSQGEDNFTNNLLFVGLIITIVIIMVTVISQEIRKVEPFDTEPRVEPLFNPVFQDYDYAAWSSSSSNWSQVNDEWEAHPSYEPGPEYGSYEQQYETLYSNPTPKRHW